VATNVSCWLPKPSQDVCVSQGGGNGKTRASVDWDNVCDGAADIVVFVVVRVSQWGLAMASNAECCGQECGGTDGEESLFCVFFCFGQRRRRCPKVVDTVPRVMMAGEKHEQGAEGPVG
jgi:hypothetical protein